MLLWTLYPIWFLIYPRSSLSLLCWEAGFMLPWGESIFLSFSFFIHRYKTFSFLCFKLFKERLKSFLPKNKHQLFLKILNTPHQSWWFLIVLVIPHLVYSVILHLTHICMVDEESNALIAALEPHYFICGL
jgi:hypothetical protein